MLKCSFLSIVTDEYILMQSLKFVLDLNLAYIKFQLIFHWTVTATMKIAEQYLSFFYVCHAAGRPRNWQIWSEIKSLFEILKAKT